MNNKIIIGIAVVIAIAVGVYLMAGSDGTDLASDNMSAESATQASVENSSIKSLIENGENHQCTFSTTEEGYQSSGTVYTADGKMRGDFTSEVNGVKTMSHMIYDGSVSYVWTDGSNSGFKMALDANAQAQGQNQAMDPNKNYKFDCERWSPDNSKFETPSGVQFSDLGAMTGGAAAGAAAGANASSSASTKAMQQQICSSLSEPAKTQCLNAIR